MAGRKGLYEEWITEDGLTSIEGWAREGATDAQIAKKIGISVTTFCEWKNRFPEFAKALKKGKAPVDFKVENQLLKSALGYFIEVEEPIKLKKKTVKNGVGTIEEEHIEMVTKKVYVPPNVTAQFFWLKNRKPDKWRDRQEKNVTVDVEDLAPLAEMLNEDTDDTVETVQPEA